MKSNTTTTGAIASSLIMVLLITISPPTGADLQTSEGADALICDSSLAPYFCTAWAARYDGPSSGNDAAFAMAMDPAGERVFVGGQARVSGSTDYATVAYDARTGEEIWVSLYGYDVGLNIVRAIDVSPDGTRVYVTGESRTDLANPDRHYDTVAYDAATGAEVWVSRYEAPAPGIDVAKALKVSPDGARVYVTGESNGIGTGLDYATLAYDATDGTELWVSRYDGLLGGDDMAHDLVLAPDGSAVYVTGRSQGIGTSIDYATIAYDSHAGGVLWMGRYNGPDSGVDIANGLVLSPDGSSVYVAGHSLGNGNDDFAVINYDATNGDEVWVGRYNGEQNGWDIAVDLDIAPDGSRVFVTGFGPGPESGHDMLTVAFDTVDGTTAWAARFDGTGAPDKANAIAVSPDGARVVITGESNGDGTGYADMMTVAYDASDGTEQWAARASDLLGLHENLGYQSFDSGEDIVIHPDSSMVYITGLTRSDGDLTGYNFQTIAYGALAPPSLGQPSPPGLPSLPVGPPL